MSKIWDDIRNEGIKEGIQEGIQKGIIISLKEIMANLNLGIEEALRALNIPEEEKAYYRKEIHS